MFLFACSLSFSFKRKAVSLSIPFSCPYRFVGLFCFIGLVIVVGLRIRPCPKHIVFRAPNKKVNQIAQRLTSNNDTHSARFSTQQAEKWSHCRLKDRLKVRL